MGAGGFRRDGGGRATSFSSFLCHPLAVSLVDIRGDGDDRVEGIVNTVGFGKPILDES